MLHIALKLPGVFQFAHQILNCLNKSSASFARNTSFPCALFERVSAVSLFGTLMSKGSAFSFAILVKAMRTTSETVNPIPANTLEASFFSSSLTRALTNAVAAMIFTRLEEFVTQRDCIPFELHFLTDIHSVSSILLIYKPI